MEAFDYVIVGAGSAGCVLAARLSEDPGCRVLLLEAGGSDRRLWVRIPLGIGKLVNDPTCTWNAEAGPEEHLLQRRIGWASGRVIGGGSSINGMLAVRGDPRRYDMWERHTGAGFGYNAMLPYFRKLENCRLPVHHIDRGRGGPIDISTVEPDPLGHAFIEACAEGGLPRLDDYNACFAAGAAPFQSSIGNGRRFSTAFGYLHPAMKRPNLTVRTGTVVQRVCFERKRAVGVEYSGGTNPERVAATGEVILSAGAIRSPQLLELSGIGQEAILRSHSVPIIHRLEAVGENLQDHLMVRLCFRCTEPITIYDFLTNRRQQLRHALNYLLHRRGLLACGSLTALAFASTGTNGDEIDARLQLGLASGLTRVSKETASGLDPFSAFHIGGYFLYPESRGSVHIRGRDANVSPLIRADYLASRSDVAATVGVLKLLRAISRAPSLSRYIVEEIRPGQAVTADADLLAYARASGDTCWHPIGTCRMGNELDSVVDREFRVHGVSGIRIADASVFPFHLSSNTNIPTIALAERAAEIIATAR